MTAQFYTVYYSRSVDGKTTLCAANEANLGVVSIKGDWGVRKSFSLPEQVTELNEYCNALSQAFDAGIREQKKVMKNFIKELLE